jgi:uncharacterized protein DUF885
VTATSPSATASSNAALDRFFAHYYERRPVNATLTGIHTFDDRLPDWSVAGLDAIDAEMADVDRALSDAVPGGTSSFPPTSDFTSVDAELARSFLAIQRSENAGSHGVRANPALWTGEAIFAVVSLMIRDFAPLEERMASASARMRAIPAFLQEMERTIGDRPIPAPWTARALKECEGARILFSSGAQTWGAPADDARLALGAFQRCAEWLSGRAAASSEAMGCGAEMYDLLLTRGHCCSRSRADLLADARARLAVERERLETMGREVAGSWQAGRDALAALHPPADEYLQTFQCIWDASSAHAAAHALVTWPDWPIRYTTFPPQTRDAAPFLYYLYYRSPAPFDRYDVYDYVVPPLPSNQSDSERQLRAWNTSVIKLNHVVHHGGIGHHVQNWHAYHRGRSRIGQIAAVDCASRIGMFCGGTMAEGWACYATALMDETGFLTPLERLSEQNSKLRFLARAIVDIELHQQTMTFDDTARFFVEHADMSPEIARGETAKASMFPGTAVMYWLGTQGILDLRETMRRRRGSTFSLSTFHDELLSYGSIPVPLIARLMTEASDA